MSDDKTLRLAATRMREQHGPEHQRHEMWSAMAALLERADQGWPAYRATSIGQRALAVARTYLGEEA